MKRSPIQRKTRLKPIGKRVMRERQTRRSFRDAIQERCREGAHGRCERCKESLPHWTMIQAHHMIPKSLGGPHDPVKNGAGLCGRCHRLVHAHMGDWQRWLIQPHKLSPASTTM